MIAELPPKTFKAKIGSARTIDLAKDFGLSDIERELVYGLQRAPQVNGPDGKSWLLVALQAPETQAILTKLQSKGVTSRTLAGPGKIKIPEQFDLKGELDSALIVEISADSREKLGIVEKPKTTSHWHSH